ncbi:MAG: Anthranilate phosphoribosyltransferase [Methanomassiliicoccales archaeon PtaU1.Bin124]|nr:MAG: Anthranilate phosphoribosyltransferase [Methanomassiliicoccales archaeon PtaU1.Bin124]
MAQMMMEEIARGVCEGTVDQTRLRNVLVEMGDRGERPEEILAFLRPFQMAAVPLPTKHEVVLDMCGTGGASFRTFNVSTLASLVVSAAGVPVAKHGNRSANGVCGSADVLRELGVKIDMSPEVASYALDNIGFAFLFAPIYHPAMRNAAQVRRDLKRKTVFNILGPLLNPVQARKRHLIGVYDGRLVDIIPPVLQGIGVDRALVVHGSPGMDEVSPLGPTYVAEVLHNGIIKYEITPKDLGLEVPGPADVAEQPPGRSAEIARSILAGEEGPRSEMVALNAAFGLYAFGAAKDIPTGLDLARDVLRSGKAAEKLDHLREISTR